MSWVCYFKHKQTVSIKIILEEKWRKNKSTCCIIYDFFFHAHFLKTRFDIEEFSNWDKLGVYQTWNLTKMLRFESCFIRKTFFRTFKFFLRKISKNQNTKSFFTRKTVFLYEKTVTLVWTFFFLYIYIFFFLNFFLCPLDFNIKKINEIFSE